MNDPHDVFLSARDAARLRTLSRDLRMDKSRSHLAEELSALLADARIVAPEHLAADRVAGGARNARPQAGLGSDVQIAQRMPFTVQVRNATRALEEELENNP